MGEAQKLSPEEQIRSAREGFDAGKDFTVAVEEEFAILDPENLGLVNRFEDFQAAAQGTEVEEHLVGELIASEVEVRTGRCETFADAAAVMVERRRQLLVSRLHGGSRCSARSLFPRAARRSRRAQHGRKRCRPVLRGAT